MKLVFEGSERERESDIVLHTDELLIEFLSVLP